MAYARRRLLPCPGVGGEDGDADGEVDGALVVGDADGEVDGALVVGDADGDVDGALQYRFLLWTHFT